MALPTGPLPEYPAPPGNKNWVIANIAGPSSYTQISTGSPPTGGQVVKASDLGLVDIEFAEVEGSDNGQYIGSVFMLGNPAAGSPSIAIMWITASSGAQVSGATNLSARTLRLRAVGH